VASTSRNRRLAPPLAGVLALAIVLSTLAGAVALAGVDPEAGHLMVAALLVAPMSWVRAVIDPHQQHCGRTRNHDVFSRHSFSL
jgi:hypothetical protein